MHLSFSTAILQHKIHTCQEFCGHSRVRLPLQPVKVLTPLNEDERRSLSGQVTKQTACPLLHYIM